jgi:hypothetical protein
MTTSTVTKPLTKARMDPRWVQVQPSIQHTWNELKGLLQSVYEYLPTSDVLSWCKKRESASEKLVRKGYESYFQINDLVKGVILVDNIDEAITIANFLQAKTNVVKLEAKVGVPNKPYCGSIHLDIQLGSLVCEIQIMPRATWKVKRATNSMYKQGVPEQGADLWNTVQNFTNSQLNSLGV